MFDTSIINVYYININQLNLSLKYLIFIFIAAVSIICQFFAYRFVRDKSVEIRRINLLNVNKLHRVVLIFQILITIVFLIIIVQMLANTAYSVHLLMASIAVNYGGGIFLLVLLSLRFFSWFIANRNYVVLLYGLSFLCISMNMFFTSFLLSASLVNKPNIVLPHFGFVSSSFMGGMFYELFKGGYTYSMIFGFILSWISTVLLLRQFSIQWKGKAHWLLLIFPMTYFLIQFYPTFTSMVLHYIRSEPVLFGIAYALFVTYSRPIGGIIFGAAFLTISRNLSLKNVSMEYTTISAYGFVLLFVSNQGFILSSAPYPPFGLATINFITLSCYLLLVGIFASAISLSQDMKLRTAIKKAVESKSNLLSSIAISQLTAEIERETTEVYSRTRKKTYDQIGIGPTMSLTEAKEYCNEVLREIKKSSNPAE